MSHKYRELLALPPRYFCDRGRHLVCRPYGIPELHAMAQALGIKRCWYHGGKHPHYDIPKRRIAEIQARATLVPGAHIIKHGLRDDDLNY
jgi:hypothetical protein